MNPIVSMADHLSIGCIFYGERMTRSGWLCAALLAAAIAAYRG